MTDDKLKPTQADRDAAAYMYGILGDHQNAKSAAVGNLDDNQIVRAFTRHRIAHARPADDVVDALCEAINDTLALLEDAPEINTSNYDHDQVCLLNSQMTQVWNRLQSAQDIVAKAVQP